MRRLLVIALLLFPALADAAWLTGWSYRTKCTADATLVDEDIGVGRIPLSAFDADWWTNVNQTDGRDIRVTTSDGETEVPVEIVGFDSTADTGAIFFKTALSTSVDTVVYVYYGNGSATMPAITDTYGAEAVWTDYEAVYHLTETGGTTAYDSTASDNDGTSNGTMTSADNVDGPTSDWAALDFDGTDDYLNNTAATGFDTNTFTISGWFYKPASATGSIFGMGTDGTFGNRRLRFLDADFGGSFRAHFYLTYSGGEAQWRHNTSAEFPAAATWFHMALTMDASSTANDPVLYIDGSATTAMGELSTPSGTRSTGADNIGIAGYWYSGGQWAGIISNFCFAASARSANYIATQYAMENDPATFWAVEYQETETSTGWRSFSTVTDTGWTDETNALTDNSTYGYDDVTSGTTSGNFDFLGPDLSDIPSDATIDTVEFRLKRTGEDGAGRELKDNTIQLIKETAIHGTNMADTVTLWGDSSVETADYTMTGWTLTPAQIKAATSGVRVKVTEDGAGAAAMARLYWGAIRVTYTPSGGGPTGPDLARGFLGTP